MIFMTTLEITIWAVVLGIILGLAILCIMAYREIQWNPDWRKSKWEKFKDEVHYIIFRTYEREDLD